MKITFKLSIRGISLLICFIPSIMFSSSAIQNDRLTPEILWSMQRIGNSTISPDGNTVIYTLTSYNINQNNSHTNLYAVNLSTLKSKQIGENKYSINRPTYIQNGERIAFLYDGVLYSMKSNGTDWKQHSTSTDKIEDYLFSPDEKHIILIKEIPSNSSIAPKEEDLPLSSGMVINDLMYKHWDHYVTSIPHPFLADFDGEKVLNQTDLLDGEPYECPLLPFGGIEQLAWSPNSKQIAYTCRKKTGKEYAISTDSDIFLYDLETKKTQNLCKSSNYIAPNIDPTRSLENQYSYTTTNTDNNLGYDQNPQFSPDGNYIAWSSMERDGYESDRARLCVYNLLNKKKLYVTESFESGVNEFCWDSNSKELYFTGVWHGCTNVYKTNFKGIVKQLTKDTCDYSLLEYNKNQKYLLLKRQSIKHPDDLYTLKVHSTTPLLKRITSVNQSIFDKLSIGEVKERWVKTVDGQQELCWVIYPPHFDKTKRYPALLFCEGGPQSPVSQFWSYRWNFQIMAANDYVIIAPNRRGLPGFGMKWLEAISGDYSGLCMKDYLSAIDDLCNEPYIDKNRLGCVGASFGGYSVYWLAGNHEKRFKAFIAHDGIYNTQQQYVETEEMWFPNWDLGSAPWVKTAEGEMQKAYKESPHLYVDKWDTPILCIHGQRDFRIEYTQAESAFAAARLRGIPAQLLLFPDENHWVLKPQNGILWQRTFFRWLNKWLKK